MARKYSIYKLISPSGKCYIGLTLQKVEKRWQDHIRKSRTGYKHPLHNAIRKYGYDNFQIKVLHTNLNLKQACMYEQFEIAWVDEKLRYNISEGGENDGAEGNKIFWSRLFSNPAELKKYKEKLSLVKRDNDWTDYIKLARTNKQWRKDNPKESYKLSYRALRIAMKNVKPKPKAEKEMSLKDRLMWKHRRDLATKKSVTAIWANRDEETKNKIGSSISATQKQRMSFKTDEEKKIMTEKARLSIDRKKQGAAASKGIKNFWIELRKDPIKYSAYIEQRKNTLAKTNKLKKNANV